MIQVVFRLPFIFWVKIKIHIIGLDQNPLHQIDGWRSSIFVRVAATLSCDESHDVNVLKNIDESVDHGCLQEETPQVKSNAFFNF